MRRAIAWAVTLLMWIVAFLVAGFFIVVGIACSGC